MTIFFDEADRMDPLERERALFRALPGQLAHAKAKTAYFARVLADIEPQDIADRRSLARIPVTRKSDLTEAQAALPPFGGMIVGDRGMMAHLFRSPGPIADPGGSGQDWWRAARALHAAGLRAGDVMHNCFSYHLTPAGLILDSGARAVGAAVFPGGPGNTDQQIEALAFFRARAFASTPDFLKIVLDRAAETGIALPTLEIGIVGGGALTPGLRRAIADHGVAARQNYATADLGIVAYESEALEGLIVNEDLILEIVRSGTGDPVPEGEVGEVVVTLTANRDYPLIRFATGDLSAMLPGPSPCGRTAPRIAGWMGRADQSTKVRGMFVRPPQIARIVDRHPGLARARLIVDQTDGRDRMILMVETRPHADEDEEAIGATVRAVCNLSAEVQLVRAGTIPNDGKVIEDRRTYD